MNDFTREELLKIQGFESISGISGSGYQPLKCAPINFFLDISRLRIPAISLALDTVQTMQEQEDNQ